MRIYFYFLSSVVISLFLSSGSVMASNERDLALAILAQLGPQVNELAASNSEAGRLAKEAYIRAVDDCNPASGQTDNYCKMMADRAMGIMNMAQKQVAPGRVPDVPSLGPGGSSRTVLKGPVLQFDQPKDPVDKGGARCIERNNETVANLPTNEKELYERRLNNCRAYVSAGMLYMDANQEAPRIAGIGGTPQRQAVVSSAETLLAKYKEGQGVCFDNGENLETNPLVRPACEDFLKDLKAKQTDLAKKLDTYRVASGKNRAYQKKLEAGIPDQVKPFPTAPANKGKVLGFFKRKK